MLLPAMAARFWSRISPQSVGESLDAVLGDAVWSTTAERVSTEHTGCVHDSPPSFLD